MSEQPKALRLAGIIDGAKVGGIDPEIATELRRQHAEIERLKRVCSLWNDDLSQTLGRALGYPKFADDQKVFPGATEADGVCVGDHVAESLAAEAALEIERLRAEVGRKSDAIQRLWKERDEARAEVETLRADAERYRYLRNRKPDEVLWRDGVAAGLWIDIETDDLRLVLMTGADADAAIDAAMKEA